MKSRFKTLKVILLMTIVVVSTSNVFTTIVRADETQEETVTTEEMIVTENSKGETEEKNKIEQVSDQNQEYGAELKAYVVLDSYKKRLNVRTEPKEDATVLEKLKPGEVVILGAEESENWIEVLTTNGTTGFVSKKYLQTQSLDVQSYELISAAVVTKKDSSENRNFNMSKASEAINGYIMLPEDEFNWYGKNWEGGVVGNASKENGYKKAGVIVNKKSTTGYGGGVCQVSTTLYNAILRAGISDIHKNEHSLKSSYIEDGMDATVSYKSSNFWFTNTLDYPIMIWAHTNGAQVIVEIYRILPVK